MSTGPKPKAKLVRQVKNLKQLETKVAREVGARANSKPPRKFREIHVKSLASKGGSEWQGSAPRVKVPTGKRNTYMEQLINPPAFADFRLPDQFSRPSATSSPKLFKTPFYFPANSVVEKPGRYYYAARPSMVHPLWSYGVVPYAAPTLLCMSGQSKRFGVFGKGIGDITHAEQDGEPWLSSGVEYNLKLAKYCKNRDHIEDPFKDIGADGSNFFGHTFSMGTAACNMNMSATFAGDVGLNDTLTFRYKKNDGTTVTQVFTLAAAAERVGGNSGSILGLGVTDATNGLGTCTPMPGVAVTVQFDALGTSSGIMLQTVCAKVNATTPAVNDLGMYPIDWEAQDTYVKNVQMFRPCGGMLWSKYEGNTLENGGCHSCMLYGGGDHPNSTGLWNFEKLAVEPEAYEGAMKNGSYQWWKPYSEIDQVYRPIINMEEWTHPYWIVSGIVGDVGQTTPLRVEMYVNFEMLTTAVGLWTKRSVKPNTNMMIAAQRLLTGCPTSMENDTHLETLWNWIKGATKNTMNFMYDNSAWIIPTLGAAATLL